MAPVDRRTPRYHVNLAVKFTSAQEFVAEYAENISSNGLFLRGADTLKPLQELGVTLELPGLGAFAIGVRVAHIMPPEMAARFGKPGGGAGVEIVHRPAGFDAAMTEYLRRLGARHDHAVFCHDDEPLSYFGRMGYQAQPLPGFGEFVGALAKCKQTVVAVVVPRAAERLFRTMLARIGSEELLSVAETEAELDALLSEIDQRL